MVSPTVLGWPWLGNNKEGSQFSKPDNKNVNRWKERITEHEAQLIEYYFSGIMEEYGYKPYYNKTLQQSAASEHYKWHNFSTPYSDS